MLNLEAFAVDDAWAGFIVLFLSDPHALEGGEGSQNGATDPYGVLSLRWGNDLDLDGGRAYYEKISGAKIPQVGEDEDRCEVY